MFPKELKTTHEPSQTVPFRSSSGGSQAPLLSRPWQKLHLQWVPQTLWTGHSHRQAGMLHGRCLPGVVVPFRQGCPFAFLHLHAWHRCSSSPLSKKAMEVRDNCLWGNCASGERSWGRKQIDWVAQTRGRASREEREKGKPRCLLLG